MTDYFWPLDIPVAGLQWKILDASGMFPSPLSGATRTVTRPGTRMGCSLQLTTLKDSNRYRILGLLGALKGRANRIWMPDISNPVRGSFPTTELLSNVAMASTTGWTASGSELSLQASSGRLRQTRSAATTDAYAYSSCTTVSGSQYLFRAGIIAGRGAVNYDIRLGTSNTGAEISSSGAQTAAALKHAVGAASGTTTFANVKDIFTGKAADYFQSIEGPSVSRCALVNGGSQTGSGLNIDGLPASVNGLLVAGDVVSIYTTQWEPKRVAQDLNSNASGQGYLIFEPNLRVSPPDNSPISIYQPMARFLLAGDSVDWDAQPGLFSNLQIDLIEDVT